MKKILLGLMLTLSLGLSISAFASAQINLPITNGNIGPGAVGSAKLVGLIKDVDYNISCQVNSKDEGIYLMFNDPGIDKGIQAAPPFLFNGQHSGNQVILRQGSNSVVFLDIGTFYFSSANPELIFKNLDNTSSIQLTSCIATPAVY